MHVIMFERSCVELKLHCIICVSRISFFMFSLNYNIVLNDLNNWGYSTALFLYVGIFIETFCKFMVLICGMHFIFLSYVIAIQAFTFYISGFGVYSVEWCKRICTTDPN